MHDPDYRSLYKKNSDQFEQIPCLPTRAKTMQERFYGLKKILCFEFAACFLSPSSRAKKRGKFKIKNFSKSIESFLYCLSSRQTLKTVSPMKKLSDVCKILRNVMRHPFLQYDFFKKTYLPSGNALNMPI